MFRSPRRSAISFSNSASLKSEIPDSTIEILSPDRSQTKVTKNILHCLNYGTEMGWLIDPEERTMFVFQLKQQTLVFDLPGQQLPIPSFASELNLTVEEVFTWLLE